MTQYTITLSETENKALSYAAVSNQDWIDNAVHERCRIAIDTIAKIAIDKCLETGTQIPGSKEEMVDLAFSKGWVITAEEQHAQFVASSKLAE